MARGERADESVNKASFFRDNLYRLTLTSLSDLEHATWSAPEDKVNTCQNKGQSVEDCHNYVKVLLSNGKSLFTCGTYAFSPWCAWREVRSTREGGTIEIIRERDDETSFSFFFPFSFALFGPRRQLERENGRGLAIRVADMLTFSTTA